MDRPWSLEIASWMRLGGLLKHFGSVLRPSKCILECLEGVWRAPKQAQASVEEGLERFLLGFFVFFRGRERKGRISKNIDFAQGKIIFSRVRRFKIEPKSIEIRSWRLKFDFGGQTSAKMSILEAKKTILEAKKAVLEAKRTILEAEMPKVIFYVDFLDRSVEWRGL